MNLGTRIKELRQNLSLSQPEFSVMVGIEQSYLSKLENNKCTPSNEIFRSLLSAASMNIDEFMAPIDVNSEYGKLKQIPDAEQWMQERQKRALSHMKQFVLSCCLLIALGASMLYAGTSQIFFHNVLYEYESLGVLTVEEPDDYIQNWRSYLPRGDFDKLEIQKLEIEKRKSYESKLVETYKGNSFVEKVSGGKRLFTNIGEVEVPRIANAWLQSIGILLLVFGIAALVFEKRILKALR